MISMMRMTTKSVFPPRNPAAIPSGTPMTQATMTARKPTI